MTRLFLESKSSVLTLAPSSFPAPVDWESPLFPAALDRSLMRSRVVLSTLMLLFRREPMQLLQWEPPALLFRCELLPFFRGLRWPTRFPPLLRRAELLLLRGFSVLLLLPGFSVPLLFRFFSDPLLFGVFSVPLFFWGFSVPLLFWGFSVLPFLQGFSRHLDRFFRRSSTISFWGLGEPSPSRFAAGPDSDAAGSVVGGEGKQGSFVKQCSPPSLGTLLGQAVLFMLKLEEVLSPLPEAATV
mmetsp:Transcript_39424/g.92084  ORF Transcript_39424/g.92084 Transcript_39424/m.92084 type:complete len:242 (+) Transcript_39424:2487-3212(+)